MNSWLGIDCGVKGAVAWLHKNPNGFDVRIFDMPVKTKMVGKKRRNEVDVFELTKIVQSFGNPVAVIEAQWPRQTDGKVQAFASGAGFGAVLGVCAGSRLAIELVTPNRWKRELGLSKDKNLSIQVAKELYPQSTGLLTRKKDDGRAEALLIAHWGMKNCL